MARVFRQQYTRPIPEGAQRTTAKVKRHGKEREVAAVRFRGEDGKWVVAPVVESGRQAGTHCRVNSPNYYGRVNGKPVCLCTNRQAAETMLADLIRKKERGEAGLLDPFEGHRARPLSEHLADYEKFMKAKDVTAKQVRLQIGRIRRVFEAGKMVRLADVTEGAVLAVLAEMRKERELPPIPPGDVFTLEQTAQALGIEKVSVGSLIKRHALPATGKGRARRYPRSTVETLRERLSQGHGPHTVNHYIGALRSFGRWLVRPSARRLPVDPFAGLERLNEEEDVRCARRPLTGEELRKVIASAGRSKKTFRGLAGRDRSLLYATAAASGFRAQELASLTPGSFVLGGSIPKVGMPGRNTKNRRTVSQPIPDDLARGLSAYLQGRATGEPVWPGMWWTNAADMLRIDLEEAGIPFLVSAPEGDLRADFHALRHSFVALCDQAGLSLKEAMQLARHSDPRLTASRYGRHQEETLAAAVNRLPSLLPGQEIVPNSLAPTGTEGVFAYTPLTQTPDGERIRVMETETRQGVEPPLMRGCNSLTGNSLRESEGERNCLKEEAEVRVELTSSGLTVLSVADSACTSSDASLSWSTTCDSTKEATGNLRDPLTQALHSPTQDIPSELARVVTAWSDLPLPIRVAILSLVEANQGK